jgi:hypothetical protein
MWVASHKINGRYVFDVFYGERFLQRLETYQEAVVFLSREFM